MHREARSARVLLVAFLFSGALTVCAAGPGPVDSRVVAVTVFPDRAAVVREARIDLPAGSSRWEFPRLPWDVEPDSLQVSSSGVPCIIGAVDLREEVHEPVETDDLAQARVEVQRLEDETARLGAEAEVDGALRSFLDAAAVAAVTPRSEGEPASLDPAALAATYDLLEDRLARLGDGRVARAGRQRELKQQLELARARLATARPAGALRSRTAAVELSASRAGEVVVRLSYVTPGASWAPSYRAELSPGSSVVALSSEAEVRQSTGEDWSDVALTLSTENPSRAVRPPELSPSFLRIAAGPLPTSGSTRVDGANLAVDGGVTGTFGQYLNLESISEIEAITTGKSAEFSQTQGGLANIVRGRPPEGWVIEVDAEGNPLPSPDSSPAHPGRIASATLAGTSYHVSFEVAGTSDIPSDGTIHRVALRVDTIDVELQHLTAPALSPSAYLVATARSPRDYPLLPGPVRVVIDGGYRGRFQVAETAAGDELVLPFGADRDIQVERLRLPEERERAGLARRDDRVARAYRTTVHNRRAEPATVILEERLPVSEDERIRVEIRDDTTPGGVEDPDRPGIYEWTLALEPGEERVVTVGWTVRAPRDLVIAGLRPGLP